MYEDTVIIIPARIASTRLSNKPLQMIGDCTMIEHVYKNVANSNLAKVYVATDSFEVDRLITGIGGKVIITSSNCISGTDRVYEALKQLPNDMNLQYIVNVQGDMPFIGAHTIRILLEKLHKVEADIVTPVVRVDGAYAQAPSNVKVVVNSFNQALYFSRQLIPYNCETYLCHIGIYGFTRASLTKFVSLSQSSLEKAEQLEQLRALEYGMSIAVCYADEMPISVDTKEDLVLARNLFLQKI